MYGFQAYTNAEYSLNEGLIRMDISSARPQGYVKNPQLRMDTMRKFLQQLGNPQQGIPAIHVTGTSGKGSVCAMIAGILRNAGLKVGLHISPYLQSATEKIWIDGQYASAELFADLVDWVIPKAKPLCVPQTPASIHGMASIAIAFEAFRRQQVDVMVYEAGCGGRYDLTSFVDTKVAVVTNVGLDHIVSLGPTIEQIAWHKAGIARKDAPLITGATGNALQVIQNEAHSLNIPMVTIPPTTDVQAHNRALALSAATHFAKAAKIPLSSQTIAEGIDSVKLPGRFERITEQSTTIFLDGAHNAQKLAAAVDHASKANPQGPFVAVVGLLGTKASPQTIAPLLNQFDEIIVTQPTVYGKTAFPASQSATLFNEQGIKPIIWQSPMDAVTQAVKMTGSGTLLICGSFYLCGEVRERWYPKQQVVLQQTSWPIDK